MNRYEKPLPRQALFRRGKALLALGHGDRAEKDLKQVMEAMGRGKSQLPSGND